MTTRGRMAGFAISTYDQRTIEENATERFQEEPAEFRERAVGAGFMSENGEITKLGWSTIYDDLVKFEKNALAWLKENFVSARDEGHDSYGDLVGTVWWNPRSKKQRALIILGNEERIDSDDPSYGDFVKTAWDGCSDFSIILGGQINFFNIGS